MFIGPRITKVFASRWHAAFWAAGVLLAAYEFAEHGGPSPADVAQVAGAVSPAQAASEAAPSNPWAPGAGAAPSSPQPAAAVAAPDQPPPGPQTINN